MFDFSGSGTRTVPHTLAPSCEPLLCILWAFSMQNRAAELSAEHRAYVTVTSKWKSTIHVEAVGCCIHLYESDFYSFQEWAMTRSAELRKAINHAMVDHMTHFCDLVPGIDKSLSRVVNPITNTPEWIMLPSAMPVPRLSKEYTGQASDSDTEMVRVTEVVTVQTRVCQREFRFYYRVMVQWNLPGAYLLSVSATSIGHGEGFHRHQDDMIVLYS